MTVRINKQKINLREKLAGVEDKVNFDEVVRGLGEYTGNVGIGTTNPGAKLEIFDSIKPVIKLSGTGNNTLNTNFGEIQFYNRDGSADGPNVAASIHAQSHSSTGSGGSLVFSTEDAAAGVEGQSAEPRMTILSNGNVGIGTTNPTYNFHLANSSNANFLIQKTTPGGQVDGITLNSVGGGTINNRTGDISLIMTDTEAGDSEPALRFSTTNGGQVTKHTMFISNGNVGIGTSDPGSYKLNVNGTTFCTSGTWSGSDDRIKHNEQPIVGALETLSKITPKKYIKTVEMYDANHDFELDADGNPIDSNGEPVEHRIEAGVIAQQVLTVDELAFAVSPEGVDEDGTVTSPHGLDYNSLFTYAIAAIQEQQTIINDLKSRIETLEQQ